MKSLVVLRILGVVLALCGLFAGLLGFALGSKTHGMCCRIGPVVHQDVSAFVNAVPIDHDKAMALLDGVGPIRPWTDSKKMPLAGDALRDEIRVRLGFWLAQKPSEVYDEQTIKGVDSVLVLGVISIAIGLLIFFLARHVNNSIEPPTKSDAPLPAS